MEPRRGVMATCVVGEDSVRPYALRSGGEDASETEKVHLRPTRCPAALKDSLADLAVRQAVRQLALKFRTERSRARDNDAHAAQVELVDARIPSELKGDGRDEHEEGAPIPLDERTQLDELEFGHDDDGVAAQDRPMHELRAEPSVSSNPYSCARTFEDRPWSGHRYLAGGALISGVHNLRYGHGG